MVIFKVGKAWEACDTRLLMLLRGGWNDSIFGKKERPYSRSSEKTLSE